MAQFTNQAQLSYNGNVVNSNVVVGEILDTLSAAKKAVTARYKMNDKITYVISRSIPAPRRYPALRSAMTSAGTPLARRPFIRSPMWTVRCFCISTESCRRRPLWRRDLRSSSAASHCRRTAAWCWFMRHRSTLLHPRGRRTALSTRQP